MRLRVLTKARTVATKQARFARPHTGHSPGNTPPYVQSLLGKFGFGRPLPDSAPSGLRQLILLRLDEVSAVLHKTVALLPALVDI